VAEVQVPLVGKVKQPPRGPDHDLNPTAECVDLRFVGAAAIDRDEAYAALACCQF
jgi:hypothetical protein